MTLHEDIATREAGGEDRVPPIPPRDRLHGPLTRRALRRTTLLFAVLWAAGLLPVVADLSSRWKAFGLGLLFPGAGFLYTSDPVFFVLVLVVLPYVALIRFQFRADHLTLTGLVLLTALAASFRTHTGLWDWALWAVPAALAAAVVAFRLGRRRAFAAAKERGAARNRVLAAARPTHPGASWPPAVGEHDAEDLAVLDWFLDRGLQPRDRWDGLDWRDQYSMAAMRYQLSWLQWSLALANYTRTPAFTGYLAEAQANLIERVTERRVWAYWFRENTWGNLDPDPDPIAHDNIMLSGYLALMLASYELVTGDRRFHEPGALTFRWNDRRAFPYSSPDVIDAVDRQFRATPWALFPCEPGLNFAGCNAIALLGLSVWDRAVGTDRSDSLLEPFRRSIEQEYTTADGDITSIISKRWGYGMRFVRSPVVQAGTVLFMRPLTPDIADRTWAVVRHEALSGGDLARVGPGRYDTDMGNRKKSPATRLAFFWTLAAEMGDEEIAANVRRIADERLELAEVGGVASYAACSAFANATFGLGRFGRSGAWFDMARRGMPDSWRTGPRLADAPYPEVRVARAVTDGRGLDLVVRPGRGGPGRRALGVERLAPGRRYVVVGAADDAVEADQHGRAVFEVDVDGRREVRVVPEA